MNTTKASKNIEIFDGDFFSVKCSIWLAKLLRSDRTIFFGSHREVKKITQMKDEIHSNFRIAEILNRENDKTNPIFCYYRFFLPKKNCKKATVRNYIRRKIGLSIALQIKPKKITIKSDLSLYKNNITYINIEPKIEKILNAKKSINFNNDQFILQLEHYCLKKS